MKEHAFFLEAGFMRKDSAWIQRADFFRVQFEDLLRETVQLSDRMIGCRVFGIGGACNTVYTGCGAGNKPLKWNCPGQQYYGNGEKTAVRQRNFGDQGNFRQGSAAERQGHRSVKRSDSI